ncbi:hypothetical protein Glove_341g50 [Diversispora epigaea]|uniref:Uncharacterized protein n=1 Tax=Diversispora epigaea TaxID=1348612 RepID=A0A397HGI9_9GLOM|nr:hypothetical protein Glove_341g50 [Diversispora epigaea]
MELFMYNVDEYQPLEQSNLFAPIWPFRMAISGGSDSGKTTMMINLLMGTKNVKEDGERYISCNDVVLIGKHLDEPKWKLVENFYNTLAKRGEDVSFKALSANEIPDIFEFDPARFTIVIFEDLVNASKKIQEQIADYFINENINYISLHRGGSSLLDIKRIISQYTEYSNSLASVIDDLTLKKEFIVFDLRRSRDDPLSIRVRWDTSLKSIIDHPRSNLDHPRSNLDHPRSNLDHPRSNLEQTEINILSSIENRSSKFSSYADEITVKNSDTWTKYVFREAFGIKSKDLGPEWIKFANQTKRKRESLNFYVIRNF